MVVLLSSHLNAIGTEQKAVWVVRRNDMSDDATTVNLVWTAQR